VSENSDDKRPHETLLPSLTLSVLGGFTPHDALGAALDSDLTPVPADLAEISGTSPVPVAEEAEAPKKRRRGARQGDSIGHRYVVEGQIGRGGMGRVLRVRHQALGKKFALKLIKAPIATNPRIREMFYREARLASALSHDNICSIVDFGEDPQFGLFMVMELLEGTTVHHKVHNDGRLPPKVACDVMWQIVEAVRYIHTRAIVHGDLKSENMLMTRTPDRRRVVKLLDFGLARPDVQHATEKIEGTPEYLAPERIQGAAATQASDIYALGILFYELLVGKLPFLGTIEEVFSKHMESDVPVPSQQVETPFDERADQIVARATAKDPANRHPDAATFQYELRTFMTMLGMDVGRARRGGGGTGPAESATRRSRTPDHREKAAAEIFENAPIPLACVNDKGKVRLANRAFLEFLGAAGAAGGIELEHSGLMEVYPALLDDLVIVASRGKTVKRLLYLNEGGGGVVEVAVILAPAAKASIVTKGEVHITLHPLNRYEADALS